MTMTLLITFDSAPGRRDDVVAKMGEMLPDTKAFPGCEHVELLAVDESDTGLVLFEKWTQPSDYDAYRAFRADSGTSILKSDLVKGPVVTTVLSQQF